MLRCVTSYCKNSSIMQRSFGSIIWYYVKILSNQLIFLGVRRTRAARAVATRRSRGRKKTAGPTRTTRSKRSTRSLQSVGSDEEDEVQEVSDLLQFLSCTVLQVIKHEIQILWWVENIVRDSNILCFSYSISELILKQQTHQKCGRTPCQYQLIAKS